MKKKMLFLLVGLMLVSGLSIYADTNVEDVTPRLISAPVPELYNKEKSVAFEVKQEGDKFTVVLDENPSTGFSWSYTIAEKNKVSFVKEEYIGAEVDMLGAPGKKEISFIVNQEGVSTINFEYKRPWENEVVETLRLLVYKTTDKLIVEEDKIVHIMDGAIEVSDEIDMFYKDKKIESDLNAQKINGITMIPLSSVLTEMGYTVKWIGDTRTVEISKGAQWTSVTIDKNKYFKNRMAPWSLSSAPLIVEGRTYVPLEFIAEILGVNINIENGNIKFVDGEVVIHEGYVKEITHDETGTMRITISRVKDSTDYMDYVIINTSKAYTHYNKEVKEGEYVKVISSMMMTMSIPGQTSGYVVY